MFAVISKALVRLLKTFFAIFFDTISLFLPRLLKKSWRPSPITVLSEGVIDFFFLLQIEQRPVKKFLSAPVFLLIDISPKLFVVEL